MGTFGWVLIAGAVLVLMMVANNSWPWVWQKISGNAPFSTSNVPPALSGETTPGGQPVITGPLPTPDNPVSIPPTPEVTPQNPGRILIQNPNDPNGPPLEVMG